MKVWNSHYQFNAMPAVLADLERVNGVISIGEECYAISLNPAYLHISAHYLARAEKANLLCASANFLIQRERTRLNLCEQRLHTLNQWIESGFRADDPCSVTNSLAIRTRRKPFRVTKGNVRAYLSSLASDSMPHQIDKPFDFFAGDHGDRIVLYTTIDLHYLRFSIYSDLEHRSMPYPYIHYLCNDALGGNHEFLKMIE